MNSNLKGIKKELPKIKVALIHRFEVDWIIDLIF